MIPYFMEVSVFKSQYYFQDKDGVVFSLTIEYCPDKIAVLKVKQVNLLI